MEVHIYFVFVCEPLDKKAAKHVGFRRKFAITRLPFDPDRNGFTLALFIIFKAIYITSRQKKK